MTLTIFSASILNMYAENKITESGKKPRPEFSSDIDGLAEAVAKRDGGIKKIIHGSEILEFF